VRRTDWQARSVMRCGWCIRLDARNNRKVYFTQLYL